MVINHGRLVTAGALADLEHAGVTVRTPRPASLAKLLTAAGARVEQVDSDALRVRGLTIDDIGERACDARLPLHELSAQSGSLEDLFLGWTGDQPVGASDVLEAVPV